MLNFMYKGSLTSRYGELCRITHAYLSKHQSAGRYEYCGETIYADTKYTVAFGNNVSVNVMGRNLEYVGDTSNVESCIENIFDILEIDEFSQHEFYKKTVAVEFPETPDKEYTYYCGNFDLKRGDEVVVQVYDTHKVATVVHKNPNGIGVAKNKFVIAKINKSDSKSLIVGRNYYYTNIVDKVDELKRQINERKQALAQDNKLARLKKSLADLLGR